jgi:hypothetical protein
MPKTAVKRMWEYGIKSLNGPEGKFYIGYFLTASDDINEITKTIKKLKQIFATAQMLLTKLVWTPQELMREISGSCQKEEKEKRLFENK